MRWPELWASASALVAINRPAAAAIDKGLIIIEGGLLRSLGFHCGSPSDLYRVLAAVPPSPAATPGHGLAFRHRRRKRMRVAAKPYCRGDMDCAQSRLRARVPSRA